MTIKTPECDKLTAKTDEWNTIYPFMEWLQEKGLFLCKNDTEEKAKERGEKPLKDGSYFLFPYPIPQSVTIDNLLYEYFNIDLNKLETERRAVLDNLEDVTLKILKRGIKNEKSFSKKH